LLVPYPVDDNHPKSVSGCTFLAGSSEPELDAPRRGCL
jgi:hypothetical protein